MEIASDLHHSAMDFVERAHRLRANGDPIAAVKAYREALRREREAAELVPKDLEPSRSILYRSAATIAVCCGDLDEALRMAEAGLAGAPSAEIHDDLQAIQQQILQPS